MHGKLYLQINFGVVWLTVIIINFCKLNTIGNYVCEWLSKVSTVNRLYVMIWSKLYMQVLL